MLLERFRPIKVLTEEEVKIELYRLKQKQLLGITAIGTGTLATYKLLKYISPIVDSYVYALKDNGINAYLNTTIKLNKTISFPYFASATVLQIILCASVFLFVLYLFTFIKYKKDNKLSIKDVLLAISPILLWVAMEVIF